MRNMREFGAGPIPIPQMGLRVNAINWPNSG